MAAAAGAAAGASLGGAAAGEGTAALAGSGDGDVSREGASDDGRLVETLVAAAGDALSRRSALGVSPSRPVDLSAAAAASVAEMAMASARADRGGEAEAPPLPRGEATSSIARRTAASYPPTRSVPSIERSTRPPRGEGEGDDSCCERGEGGSGGRGGRGGRGGGGGKSGGGGGLWTAGGHALEVAPLGRLFALARVELVSHAFSDGGSARQLTLLKPLCLTHRLHVLFRRVGRSVSGWRRGGLRRQHGRRRRRRHARSSDLGAVVQTRSQGSIVATCGRLDTAGARAEGAS